MTRKRDTAPETLSAIDMADYAAIRKYVPEATAKQTKWIKEMLDMARRCGGAEPIGEHILKPMHENMDEPFRMQALAGFKSAFAQELKRRQKPTLYEQTGQMGLFHPEAFSGGDNQTLRQM